MKAPANINTMDEEYSDMAPAEAPGPSQPKKRKAVKAPVNIDTTDEEYGDMALALAPGPSQPKKKKVVKHQ